MHILQVEFFLIPVRKCRAVGDLYSRVSDTLLHGVKSRSNVKLTFRVHVTEQEARDIKKEIAWHQKHHQLLTKIEKCEGWWQRQFLCWQSTRITSKVLRLDISRPKRMLRLLSSTFRNGRIVAIENLDRSFEELEVFEAHEAFESCTASDKVWVFLFEPNHDLYADTVKSVGRLI